MSTTTNLDLIDLSETSDLPELAQYPTNWNPQAVRTYLEQLQEPSLAYFVDNPLLLTAFDIPAPSASSTTKTKPVSRKQSCVLRALTHLQTVVQNRIDNDLPNLKAPVTDPNDIVRDVSALAVLANDRNFNPGPNYEGPSDVFVRPRGSNSKIAAIRLASNVVLPRYPSPTGHRDLKSFPIGAIMASRSNGLAAQLVPVPATTSQGINPAVYAYVVGEDTAILPDTQLIKVGQTENLVARRNTHQSNSAAPTRLLMTVRPIKYTLRSLEAMLIAALSPWLNNAREFFTPPYFVKYCLPLITTEATLINFCTTLSTPQGREMVQTLESRIVRGEITPTAATTTQTSKFVVTGSTHSNKSLNRELEIA